MRVLRVFHSAVVDSWRERERALRRRGHDVVVVAPRRWNEGGSDVRLAAEPGEPVVPARTFGRHPALFVYDPRPLWRLLGERWDVIDIHEEPFALATAEIRLLAALRRQRAPFTLYSAQNIDKSYPPPFGRLERSALRSAAGVSVCNREAGRIVRRKGLRRPADLIPLGVDLDLFRPATPDEPRHGVVGYVGRLETRKGVDVLIRAVASSPGLRLEIAGAGGAEETLRETARPLGDRVTFAGPLDQAALPAFYRSLDVLAVPSLDTPRWREQFGRVVVEAMASGTPVVVSDGGALAEVVGDAGVVVPQGDSVRLAEALASIVADPARRSAMAAAGPAHARASSWESVAAAYEAMYGRATGGSGDPTARPDHGVEVVVVGYGRPDLLAAALDSVTGLPLTVVDNSSEEAIRSLCRERGVRYLDPGSNLGFGAAVNVALRDPLVPGADVLLLNPDATTTPADVTRLHDVLRRDPRLAAVAPAQVDGDGRQARVAWPFPTPARAWAEAIGLGRRLPDDYVIGSVLLLARAAVDEVGLFDESFFLYAEETDWERRAVDLGWRVRLVPTVTASHLGAATSSDPRYRDALFHAAQERYFRKHHGGRGWQVARAARLSGALARVPLHRGPRRGAALRQVAAFGRGPQRALDRDGGSS